MLHHLHILRPFRALKLLGCLAPIALFVVGLAALITYLTQRKPKNP
jgi:hypothetical protein